MKKSLIAAALMSASMVPLAANAQDVPAPVAAELQVGAVVYGPQGEQVGTIEALPAGNVVLNTGAHKATLPVAAFGKNDKGLQISMTKAELDAAVSAAQAQADATMDAALVADAEVKSRDGVVVGSIQKVEGDNIVVDLPEGSAITLQKEHLTAGQAGLQLFMTAEEFRTAVAAAAGTPAPAQSGAAGEVSDSETGA